VNEIQQAWIDDVTARGYDVVGDLAELHGATPAGWSDPDQPSEKQVAGAAVDAIKALLLENARMRRTEERLSAELADTKAALERSYLRPTYRFREKVVRRLQGSGVGRAMLRAYRAARGKSSRSA
jgi:hypothetical protein